MNGSCRHEREVVRAAKEDRWTDALRAHVAECADCAEAAAVAPWLGRFAGISDREHILPDPAIVWLKAQILQGTADISRVSRPMTFVQLVAYLVVAAGWAGVLTWKWDAVESLMRRFTTPAGIVTSGAQGMSIAFISIMFVLASTTILLAMHTILAEE